LVISPYREKEGVLAEGVLEEGVLVEGVLVSSP
jgi:hypothetical protein